MAKCYVGVVSPHLGCSSVYYSTFGLSYSVVCGRVTGYQYASPNGFLAYQYDSALSVDEAYVDGVSISFGSSPRHHIWSFAAGSCPHAGSNVPPSFVGQNYFCESGSSLSEEEMCADVLWDGEGCEVGDGSCDHEGWFCVDLTRLLLKI